MKLGRFRINKNYSNGMNEAYPVNALFDFDGRTFTNEADHTYIIGVDPVHKIEWYFLEDEIGETHE
ncbi:MAG: hypothetical protein GY928_30980 [Colwellia sp.]|nr:hypothetical protein [Colwellia sp.]